MMKKGLYLLCAFLLLFILTSCGSKEEEKAPTEEELGEIDLQEQMKDPTFEVDAENADTAVREAGEEGQEYGGTVRINVTGNIDFNYGTPWVAMTQGGSPYVLAAGFEAFLTQEMRGVLTPGLALSCTPDVENNEIVFVFRDNIYFADGSKFNAEVAAWHFERWWESGLTLVSVTGVEVRGEYELAVLMGDGFNNAVPHYFTSRPYGMISKENYERLGAEAASTRPVTTAPFQLTELVPGVKAVYEKNPNYWQEGKPYLDSIECVNINDVMTQNAAILSKGEDAIDILINPGFEQISALLLDPDLGLNTYASGYTSLFPSSINEDSPFAKIEVREAVSYAIDRELLVEARGFGIAMPAKQIIVENYLGFFEDGRNYFPYDQDKAKELLAQAGYPDGFDTTLFAGSTADLDLVVAVQKMLEDVGIRCTLEIIETGAAIEMGSVTGWEGLYMAPFTNVVSMPTTFTMFDDNYTQMISVWRPVDEFMPILRESRVTPWFENSLFQDINNIFCENMVFMPLITSHFSYVVRNNVLGGEFGFHGGGTIYLPQEMWRSTN